MVEIKYSKKVQREKLVELLDKLIQTLKDGKGVLKLDSYSLSVEIPDEVNVELELEVENKKK
ncbi:MAG: amphi-Trp domain-containing protein, partial [Candidatus Odinarchaeia archaeon]